MAGSSPSLTNGRRIRVGWLRLHRLSWLAMLVTLAMMVIIVVPGETGLDSELGDGLDEIIVPQRRNRPMVVEVFDHGWPLTFLSRAKAYGGQRPLSLIKPGEISWLNAEYWPIAFNTRRWDFRSLAVDVAAVLVIASTIGAGCEMWIRRRGGRVRLRIADCLLITGAVACALGWRAWHLQQQRVEIIAVRALIVQPGLFVGLGGSLSGWKSLKRAEPFEPRFLDVGYVENGAPAWLRRLAGGEALVPAFRHPTCLALNLDKANESSWETIRRMRHIEELEIYSRVTEAMANELQQLPSLRHVTLRPSHDGPPKSQTLANLQRANDYHYVAMIPQLEAITIATGNATLKGLERLAELPRLKKVTIVQTYTPEELARYDAFKASHPELDVEITWGNGMRR